MATLLFITDVHARGSSPEGRRDDYPQAIYTKLREVGKLASAQKVEAVVCGGDLFHEPDPATSVVSTVARIFRQYPCPIYVVWGSHDIFAYNAQTLPRTALGVLVHAGVVQLLQPHEVTRIGPFDVVGCSHTYGLDSRVENYTVRQKELVGARQGAPLVQVVHGMLVPKPFEVGTIQATLIKDVDTDATFVLSGHYHPGYGVVQTLTTTFCNPGSLGRLENTASNRTRTVQGAIVSERGIELVPVPCQPGKEVFEECLEDVDGRRELDAFIKQLHKQMGTIELQDAKQLLLAVAREKGASDAVCLELVETVEQARKAQR